MCYYQKIKDDKVKITKRFNAEFQLPEIIIPSGRLNGFSHPETPIITNENPDVIVGGTWGLIPHWAKDNSIQKNTLNCMIETADEKPSFRSAVNNRCLIISSEFYEWKHNIINGKLVKIPYRISVPGEDYFVFAGLFNVWKGVITYTILTTEANELMAEVHNSKKRMPVVLRREEEKLWLQREPLEPYRNRKEVDLIAEII